MDPNLSFLTHALGFLPAYTVQLYTIALFECEPTLVNFSTSSICYNTFVELLRGYPGTLDLEVEKLRPSHIDRRAGTKDPFCAL